MDDKTEGQKYEDPQRTKYSINAYMHECKSFPHQLGLTKAKQKTVSIQHRNNLQELFSLVALDIKLIIAGTFP